MEKQDFLKQFNAVATDGRYGHRKKEEVQELIRQHMLALGRPDTPIGFQELFIAIEELAELIQATTKALRGKKDEVNLVEELADVHLVLDYIETALYVDHNDVEIALEVKIRKLEKLLEDGRKQGLSMHDKPGKELL